MEGISRRSLNDVRGRLDELISGADAAEVGDQLFAVADLLDGELRLRRAFADPGTAPGARRGLVERLLGSQLSDAGQKVVGEVVAARWHRPVDLVAGLDELGASALLAAADTSGGALDEVEDELFRFGRLVARESKLALAFSDPTLPADRKVGLVKRLLGERASATTLRLVERVVSHPRGRTVPGALEELAELAAERRSRSIAVVTTARPLDDDQSSRLAAALSTAFGREMQLQVDVDPSLLGGVVVRVGDELVDGSVARRLAELRRRLLR